VRRGFAALGLILVAAAMTVGSGANFSAESVSSGNVIKAGIVALSNGASGSAVINVTGLAPGHSLPSLVDMANAGDLPAVITLTTSNLVDAPASPALSAKLNLLVEDTSKSSTVFSGKLNAFSSASLGTWAPGEEHRLRFTVSFPDGGAGGTDDAYQGARSTINLTWRAVGSDPCPVSTTGTTTTTSTTTTTTPTTTTSTTSGGTSPAVGCT
jgi:spore coat-associated protein N